MSFEKMLEETWNIYLQTTQSVAQINEVLEARGETIINDHIALRTLAGEEMGLEKWTTVFESWGLKRGDKYTFSEKKLKAYDFYSPSDLKLPRIFISELEWREFSPEFQAPLKSLLSSFPAQFDLSQFWKDPRPWKINLKDYQKLLQESEYGPWFYTMGFRPNHFTINVNELKTFENLKDLNDFIKKNGFLLNSSGGEIKGGPEVFLEQSSTMADKMLVEFEDGAREVPSCYYEFAKRFRDKSGQIYQGFVTQSADKIFESTHR